MSGIAAEFDHLRALIPPHGQACETRVHVLALVAYRRLIRRSFEAWCMHALEPLGQRPARHHRLMIDELEKVASGETDRLMLLMPPGHAKSMYATILFPSWWFSQHPRSSVISSSYGAELADDFGRKVRAVVAKNSTSIGYDLASDNKAVARWATTKGGAYFGLGVGGATTGRRADLIIVDDPVKGAQEAASDTTRDAIWNWYQANLYTRATPGARIILIQTRWNEDDLGGRLLSAQDDGGDKWRVLRLPALCDTNDDPLGRSIGEALWPEWEDVGKLARKRAAVGEYFWSALFQQNPRPDEGSLFKTGMIDTLSAAPAGKHIARAWDLAATAQTGSKDPDWSVGVKMLRTDDGRYVVLDVKRIRGGPDEVEATIVNTAKQDGFGVRVGLPQDPGQAGKAQIKYLTGKLSGYRVESSPETGDKATRASPMASQCNVGNLSVVSAPWNRTFLDELTGFPNAAKDDQVDALSRAFSMVGLSAGPIRISPEVVAKYASGRR